MNSRVLVVLAGSSLGAERMGDWAKSADIVVAVDGGFHHCIEAGIVPSFLTGDYDSLGNTEVPPSVRKVPLPDQSLTDFAKTLAWCSEQGYRAVHVICAEGELPDHQLQNLLTAASYELAVTFVFRQGLGRILSGNSSPTAISTQSGSRVSLVPLTECSGVGLTGVEWPLQDAILSPLGASGISNRSTCDNVTASLREGKALLFWETNAVIWE